ncbi:MAG: ferritin-like domain-containing protein [Pseudomonadota bacterium]
MDIFNTNAAQPLVKNRSLEYLSTDISALQAISQAAINVELFTIPLYMVTLYSIQGTHQINSKGITYYKGRQWPGSSTKAKPDTANAKSFNCIFSVFIQEMLHLQMASNLGTAIGITPDFTSLALQTPDHGWHCYGKDKSIIPHIVDLKDTNRYKNVRVNTEALNENQVNLFLAIEQPEQDARKELEHLGPVMKEKYFPTVPFKNWQPDYTENNLPLFGTIGWMYECYAQYISIEYTDGESLWDKVFKLDSVQQDMFNSKVSGHPYMEFPKFDTLFTPEDKAAALSLHVSFNKAIDMMSAITDQGEGSSLNISRYRKGGTVLKSVQAKYQEDDKALEGDYPSYDNTGLPAKSSDAVARYDSTSKDHYERFAEIKALLPSVVTWEQWHAQGKTWHKDDLINELYDASTAPKNIPTPDDMAGALNRLKADEATMLPTLSKISVGAIAGITTVLDDYWKDQSSQFPYPSMVGSGDRVSICWAIFGKAPDLSVGVGAPVEGKLYHACQGLSLDGSDASNCAAIEVYHSCRGSNGCHAQGGCGFAQLDSGGGSCGSASCSALRVKAPILGKGGEVLCGGPTPPTPPASIYSAPSDNKCKTFGGCAVPISASQLFPISQPSTMQLYDFVGPEHNSTKIGTMPFQLGDSVYEKAWQAYSQVMKSRGKDAGAAPAPAATDLRIALPPST